MASCGPAVPIRGMVPSASDAAKKDEDDYGMSSLSILEPHISDLSAGPVDLIVGYIDDDTAFPAALACSALRDAVFQRWPSRDDRVRLRSTWRWAVASIARVSWAQSAGLTLNEDVCATAAAQGRQDVIEWLRSAGCPWDEGVCAAAMEEGHMALLRWLKKSGCPNDPLGWGRT
jgi:hypothetical protein